MNKYEQVMVFLKDQLHAGPGKKLPSIRELTRQFGCSRNTVIRAYGVLEKERVVYSVPKSGYYGVIRASNVETPPAEQVDFASAAPDPGVIPYAEIERGLSRAVELYGDRLFGYGDPQGFLSLRQLLSEHLKDAQIFADPARLFIVSGSQQALHVLAGMAYPNGKTAILVEQPSYAGMLRSIRLLGVPAIGMERTEEGGLDLEEMERHFRNNPIKCFYTVPRFHNPLGTSLPRRQKEKIAELAAKYDVYIIEDDYLADLETDRKADPICSYDRSGHVVHIRSFSKIMLPGLRLGVAVLPDALRETFRRYKSSMDGSTSALSQAALEIQISSGMFGRHAALMRDRYGERMRALRSTCRQLLPEGFRLSQASGGIFSLLRLPDLLPADEFSAILRQRGVMAMPAEHAFLPYYSCSTESTTRNALRLSIIRTDERQIAEGVRRIRETADEVLNRKHSVERSIIQWI